MGQSTDGQICFGVLLEEDYELPWQDYEDIEEWWIYRVCGYKNPFQLFNQDGNWLRGKKPHEDRVSEYFGKKREFSKAHPIPVELVNVCHIDYPIWIISIPETIKVAHRGFPKRIDVNTLSAKPEFYEILEKFCTGHSIEYVDGPGWFLSSYCG